MGKIKNRIKKILLVIIIILIGASIYYVNDYYRMMPEVKRYLKADEYTEFVEKDWIEYESKKETVTKGIIIYPGGKVDEKAYAPLAKELASEGFKTIITPMTLKLAILSPNKAGNVIKVYEEIEEWYIMGHSLGGVMAAQYAYRNPEKIQGLILLASYPQEKHDFSKLDIKVLSLYGNKDGFVSKEDIEKTKKLLPKEAKIVEIDGGNHSQMGWYGFQKGDNEASITREEQQKILIEEIVEFIKLKR